MYSVVKGLTDLLSGGSGKEIRFSSENVRIAIAVLYYRVILVDGRIRQEELEEYRVLIGKNLSVSEEELLLFEDKVRQAIQSDRTLSSFTEIVQSLPEKQRLEILENMRLISISDRELHEFEINLVAKTAELLGIEDWRPKRLPKQRN